MKSYRIAVYVMANVKRSLKLNKDGFNYDLLIQECEQQSKHIYFWESEYIKRNFINSDDSKEIKTKIKEVKYIVNSDLFRNSLYKEYSDKNIIKLLQMCFVLNKFRDEKSKITNSINIDIRPILNDIIHTNTRVKNLLSLFFDISYKYCLFIEDLINISI